MRASIVTRLDKLNRRVPPTLTDLSRLVFEAGEKLNQSELDAVLAGGRATVEQEALIDAWRERNKWRIWAVWDEKYPSWGDAPFWSEQGEAGQSENASNEERQGA